MDNASWERLVDRIRDDNNLVVPIVGSRLLVGLDGQSSLMVPIAKRLLERYALPTNGLPAFRELNEAVERLKAANPPGFNLQDLYGDVHKELSSLGAVSDGDIPEPIRRLAQITDFRLIVTLTPDNLLARSLRRRCAVNEIIHSPNLPTSEGRDLPADWQKRSGEMFLLYLFGQTRAVPSCVIHDEDVLEYAHNLITRGSHVPNAFLNELRDRNLLLIGCNFPDWVSRFILRATSKKRLSEKDKREWVIEQLRPEESLTCFLRMYSKETEILSDISPIEFVAELHRRWTAKRDAMAPTGPVLIEQPVPPKPMFFISYSRTTDLLSAEAMFGALHKLGVGQNEVWFDRTAIEPGQNFQDSILDGVRGCRFFLPLLSNAANAREEAFVFAEWRAARKRQEKMGREFIIPIVVDADYAPESYTNESVRDWSDKLDFGHAPHGVPDARTMRKLQQMVRSARSQAKPDGE